MRTALHPRRHWLRRGRGLLLATPLLLSTIAGCSNGDDRVVTIFGPEVDEEKESLEQTLDALTEGTGIRVEVEGTRDFEALIGGRIAAGNPPDIAMFPQPARLKDLSDESVVLPQSLGENFNNALIDHAMPGGELKAIPVKADLKSLVWYSPATFDEKGYPIPETFEEFRELIEQMRDKDDIPLCVGIESGEASGWPMTDWIEDWMLRLEGPEVYDEWVNNEIPFNDDAVTDVAEKVHELWVSDETTYGGAGAASVTFFEDAGLPVLEGECMMHRQGNFAAAYWPRGTILGNCLDDTGAILEDCAQSLDDFPDGSVVAGPVVDSCRDGEATIVLEREPEGSESSREYDSIDDLPECRAVDAFVLPGSAEHPDVILSGGLYAAAFNDDESVMEVMELIASTEFAETRAANPIGGFLSPNTEINSEAYPDELTRRFGEILSDDSRDIRFDASDLMPPAVANAFWAACVDILTPDTEKSIQDAFTDVEAIWQAHEEPEEPEPAQVR